MQKFDDFISLSGDYESRMCPSLCVCHNLNVLIFCQFSAFKEIVESDTFFGGLGKSWLEESLEEKVAGDLWYFLSYSLLTDTQTKTKLTVLQLKMRSNQH